MDNIDQSSKEAELLLFCRVLRMAIKLKKILKQQKYEQNSVNTVS